MQCVILILLLTVWIFADIDFNSMGDNDWKRVKPTGDNPNSGGDIHTAIDTAGNMYIFGGCLNGNGAGGSHNADIYRVDLKTGNFKRIANCSNNRWGWQGGCQAANCYDANRNVCWVAGGMQPNCGSGQRGFWKFQCPDGPMTRISDEGGIYFNFDLKNDLLYRASSDYVTVYNPNTNIWTQYRYPFGHVSGVELSCCVDSKRGLFVITLVGPYQNTDPSREVLDVWFFNGSTRQWHKKTPATYPPIFNKEMAYDALNDKYVVFGNNLQGCISELWAYDYDSNTWTQMQANGRSYDDNNPVGSTWPAARHKHGWEYCGKYNVFVNFGGGQWAPDACCDKNEVTLPLWFYRLYEEPSTLTRMGMPGPQVNVLQVQPNPFVSSTTIRVKRTQNTEHRRQNIKVRIFNIKGELVTILSPVFWSLHSGITWNAHDLPGGIYILKFRSDNKTLTKQIVLSK